MAGSIVPFKVYVFHNESEDPEIRRFGLPASEASSFQNFSETITELFPSVPNKAFRIYWEDEDNDRVAISSDVEFIIALTSMNSGPKKFYVKIQSPAGAREHENSVLHRGIYCDTCECDIIGFRYKCLICKDYDLCRTCEQAGMHADHLMLKIPHPFCIDRVNLSKLIEFVTSSIPFTPVPRDPPCSLRRHSHDTSHSDSHRKKKRSEKREAVYDMRDEMEDGWHKKHSHKKSRKQSACPYTQMMEYFNPVHFESSHAFLSPKKTREEGGHLTYLKSIATTVQKLLDPLGVNVELEVRPNRENVETKGKEKKKEEEEPAPGPAPSAPETDATPSAPPQKEVRFASPELIAEKVKQGIEEITKNLAGQKINNGNSADNDGWVSFEELKRDSEKSQADGSVESPRGERSASQTERSTEKETSSENLYPDLTREESSRRVREALQQMLSMGFTNEGNWLTSLLEAKQGDICQVLEVLAPVKKN